MMHQRHQREAVSHKLQELGHILYDYFGLEKSLDAFGLYSPTTLTLMGNHLEYTGGEFLTMPYTKGVYAVILPHQRPLMHVQVLFLPSKRHYHLDLAILDEYAFETNDEILPIYTLLLGSHLHKKELDNGFCMVVYNDVPYTRGYGARQALQKITMHVLHLLNHSWTDYWGDANSLYLDDFFMQAIWQNYQAYYYPPYTAATLHGVLYGKYHDQGVLVNHLHVVVDEPPLRLRGYQWYLIQVDGMQDHLKAIKANRFALFRAHLAKINKQRMQRFERKARSLKAKGDDFFAGQAHLDYVYYHTPKPHKDIADLTKKQIENADEPLRSYFRYLEGERHRCYQLDYALRIGDASLAIDLMNRSLVSFREDYAGDMPGFVPLQAQLRAYAKVRALQLACTSDGLFIALIPKPFNPDLVLKRLMKRSYGQLRISAFDRLL